ncbi:MAG: transketolase C-terminal domain-containing protein, partial [Anaerolineales bacterium]
QELLDPKAHSEFTVESQGSPYPEYRVAIKGAPAPVMTMLAYGHMAELARQAMLQLAYEQEIFTELIVPTQISPFELRNATEHAQATGRLLVLEEGTKTLGYGAEVVARLQSEMDHAIQCRRVAALDMPVPAAGQLENKMLPQVEDVVSAARELLRRHA